MAASKADDVQNHEEDKYRSYLYGEGEKKTEWRFGAAPNYHLVNKLFEQGRTKIWPAGSLEEKVQNLVKTYEMELFHKACVDDIKSIDPKKFILSLNGGKPVSLKEIGKLGGGYNVMLQSSLPEELQVYKPAEETEDSSHRIFTTTFPRGFALEILQVYSGPPLIVYKFRHWAYMEGPFKGHAATGELVEFYGMANFQLDEQKRIVSVEFFYDPGQLLAGLVKGPKIENYVQGARPAGCPILRSTG